MSATFPTADRITPARKSGWRELWLKEDWWAVWLGLALVIVAFALFAGGSSIAWIAVAPAKWSTFSELGGQLLANAARYFAQFGFFLVIFTVATSAMGHRARNFIPSFFLIYLLSLAVFAVGAWDQAQRYNLEPPLVALLIGLLIANLTSLPRWLDTAFRVEFYIKTGIVLLGATLPFTLVIWAGPIAILQASIVSIVTFLVIFFVGRRLGLDHQLSATLGAGGAVCGVSAAIAVGAAVRARKEYPPIAITLVIFWAILWIFALPLVSRALQLPTGVGGAWIGTSEFADAAGFAAAQSYGGMAGHGTGISGTADQAVSAYTLIKVIGRDIWIGIWAFVLAILSVTRWEKSETGQKVEIGQIWWRFPKFVIGFLVASIVVTWAVGSGSYGDFNKIVRPALVAPITALRTWAFTFCFLSIGLTTRLREFVPTGSRPFVAFTAGVIINVILGFILSVLIFGHYWATLGH